MPQVVSRVRSLGPDSVIVPQTAWLFGVVDAKSAQMVPVPVPVTPQEQQSESLSMYLADAYFLLAIALAAGLGYHPAIVTVLLASFGAVAISVFAARPNAKVHLQGLCLLSMAILLGANNPAETSNYTYVMLCRGSTVPFLFLAALLESGTERTRRMVLAIATVLKLALLVGGLYVVPHPTIDVWQLQQHAVDFLLQGKNPYTTPVADIYVGGIAFGYQKYYAYAPLNLLLSIPAKVIFGDYRFGLIAALAASLALFRACGRRLGVSSFRIDFLTMAALLHPRLERLMIYGWLEPYLVLLLSLFVYLYATGRRGTLLTVVLFAMPLLKQYFAVPIVIYLIIMRPRVRSVIIAALAGVLALSPLLLWNFEATVRNGLLFFVQNIGFRPDSLSVAAGIFAYNGYETGVKTALLAQLAAGLLAAWFLRRKDNRLASFLMASALSLFASFLAAPQSFINYYFFVGVLVLFAALTSSPSTARRPESPQISLPHALIRAFAVLGITCFLLFLFHFIFDFRLCPRIASVGRDRMGSGRPLLDDGAWIAKQTEQIYICQSHHCLGPICHDDLHCICADRDAVPTAPALEQKLRQERRTGVACTLDKARPTASDHSGGCWKAHCHDRIQ